MNRTRLGAASRFLAASACVFVLGQQAVAAANFHPFEGRIRGVWDVRVTITNCEAPGVPGSLVITNFYALNVFAADGTFLDTNSQTPTAQSAHFGYWRHVRGNKYEFAQKFFTFDAAGQNSGWRIVRHEVLLSRDGDSFMSSGSAEFFNVDGGLVGTGCSTSTAVRFE